jgi:aspartate ammonia-lyase
MTDRIEEDLLGKLPVPADALYGIHTLRAMRNFLLAKRGVHPSLIHAYGAVKLACARVNHHHLHKWDEMTFRAIENACGEMMSGDLDQYILVDALQGGAGTSTNMNVNEVLTNRSLLLLGHHPGEYSILHPVDDMNLHQSTNDTYPTALHVAAIYMLHSLERAIVALLEAFQQKEKEMAHVVKVARTEMQDAVLTTLGRSMGAYADALARDRWRIYKCEERLRVINLGGIAIGTGLGAPRLYIFRVAEVLREITGLGLARAENLIDATQNTDVYVEVSGILSALASTLIKISSDLRLLSSGPDAGLAEIRLPDIQAGSSIMPGKVNPVIPEASTQACILVLANHQALVTACSMGSLELNAFMPLIADSLLYSIDLLSGTCKMLQSHCVQGIIANESQCVHHIHNSTATATALIERIGYERCREVIQQAKKNGESVRDFVLRNGWILESDFDDLISPESVTRLGNSLASPEV